jgi:hypothetical protein
LSIFWDRLIPPKPSHPVSLTCILTSPNIYQVFEVAPWRCPKRAICSPHLILLDFITRIIFFKQYKQWISSLWNLPSLLLLPPSFA